MRRLLDATPDVTIAELAGVEAQRQEYLRAIASVNPKLDLIDESG